ncbi:hypothetical protein C8R44DRAFT_816907 [Mycena epipterygia]|nr:hypothetical protein C8R44DRAFT_816907 [Mycena epipterygia]
MPPVPQLPPIPLARAQRLRAIVPVILRLRVPSAPRAAHLWAGSPRAQATRRCHISSSGSDAVACTPRATPKMKVSGAAHEAKETRHVPIPALLSCMGKMCDGLGDIGRWGVKGAVGRGRE